MKASKILLWGLIGPLAFCLVSCGIFSSETTQDATKTVAVDGGPFYKRDMIIQVNNKVFEGVGVVPIQPLYKLTIDAKGTLDLLTVTNCHRDVAKEQAFEKGLFKDRSRTSMTIQLFDEEESQYSCPLQIGGYEVKGGRHSWGFIDFQNPAMKLGVQAKCNGLKTDFVGVGVCQAAQGTFQFLKFSGEVIYEASADCPAWESTDEKSFKIKIGKGTCTYRFMEKAEAGEKFRITTLGYDQILIREKL